jgi:hypothetical protein
MWINDLPEEILDSIFHFAADDNVIFDKKLPTAFSKSSWFRVDPHERWLLRTPQESLHLRQKRSRATEKVRLGSFFLHSMTMVVYHTSFAKSVISTCKSWRRIGSGFLFRCLFFEEGGKMHTFSTLFDSAPVLGQRTRRIHVGERVSCYELECDLVPLIRHCPNLEIVIIEGVMFNPFGSIVDSLSTHCSNSLQSIHWSLPINELPKVIWALDSLPSLTSIHVEFFLSSWEDYHLGAANDIVLDLPNLCQLSLEGHVEEFMEQACKWNMSSLKSFSLDLRYKSIAQSYIIQFLSHHGSKLTFLDIYSIPAYDVARILDLCPSLQTFAFNADWPLPAYPSKDPEDFDNIGGPLIHQPHQHITHIGLHGLQFAFNVRNVTSDSGAHRKRKENNDRNFYSLTRRRADFPKLNCVRVLSLAVLQALEVGGPSQECLERWDRWWQVCDKAGIRLEDCTGGNLLQKLYDEERLFEWAGKIISTRLGTWVK